MIGSMYDSGERVWVVEHTIAFAKFYIEDLGNVVGGNLHIVLSDGNLDDGHIKYCLDQARTLKDHVGVALAECLLELSLEERNTLYQAIQS